MSNTIEIRVPDIGDFSDIPVIEILVSEGDRVTMEDSLVTLESDKATMEVPSPAAGVIREMKLKLDDTVSEGDVVAVLEVSAEITQSGDKEKQADKVEQPVPEPAPEPAPAIGHGVWARGRARGRARRRCLTGSRMRRPGRGHKGGGLPDLSPAGGAD